MADWIKNLCSAERDRVTAAEICIDELMTIMDRHSYTGPEREKAAYLSIALHGELTEADGLKTRRTRIMKIRRALTDAMPMTDEDLVSESSTG